MILLRVYSRNYPVDDVFSIFHTTPEARLTAFFSYFMQKKMSSFFGLHHIILMCALCWYYLYTLLAKARKNGSIVCFCNLKRNLIAMYVTVVPPTIYNMQLTSTSHPSYVAIVLPKQ
jgi:hypothetical protein